MDQRFAPQAGQVEGSARDEQTQDILWLCSATLWIKLNGGPTDTVWERYLRQGERDGKVNFNLNYNHVSYFFQM